MIENFEFKLIKQEAANKVEDSEEKRKQIMETFYQKYFKLEEKVEESEEEKSKEREGVKTITLEDLKELKETGVSLENFLDYLCQEHDFLLHGSINEITDDKLISRKGQIFATNKAAIAIMRSLYSNINVSLEYPYFISDNKTTKVKIYKGRIIRKQPLVLKIHTPPDGQFIKKDKGFVYLVKNEGFKNKPEGSWQFIKEAEKTDDLDTLEVQIYAKIETESDDFKYPVEIIKDLSK